ncbi:C45 family autoproteolytic acyltransferase/hydolase [Agaribacterium haliotis]|uniref:C45 family autoproteolytic acyltransferase/hydolase n=1 Tax=Agaribacterium haliotis TaxID=2013869 RepID=UPI000BB58B82|nr:C45 family autoproteolytic acyltransferase/hydolase [Agaribacterium haliotis]
MKIKKVVSFCSAMALSFCAHAELIQHSEQIAEVRFSGSSYELGLHVGEVAKEQILDGIARFDKTLDFMLPGMSVAELARTMQAQQLYQRLEQVSPDAADYLEGLSLSLERDPHFLLAVAMSDEAILESQKNGGVGFMQNSLSYSASTPSRCTVMAISDKQGRAWGQANFDYMAANYEGLIVLNHLDDDGKRRVIQTWAGLIPYGGVNKGGQALLMNTMADEGSLRERNGGEVISATAVPSFYLSWEAYNTESAEQLIDVVTAYSEYTAFFSYTLVDSFGLVTNIENQTEGKVVISAKDRMAHANHSLYTHKPFVNKHFAGASVLRQEAAEAYINSADINEDKAEAQAFAKQKPLWKGRGKFMGTVSSSHFRIQGALVDIYIETDDKHPEVLIRNY